VGLFLEDLETDEPVIEEPQEMLNHILATLEYAGRVVGAKGDAPLWRFGKEGKIALVGHGALCYWCVNLNDILDLPLMGSSKTTTNTF
jgi:hypothetical protein